MQAREETNIRQEYLFSLQKSDHSKPAVKCDFSPIQCRKTYKLIRTIPTFSPDSECGFSTEGGRAMEGRVLHGSQSMKALRKEQSSIMVAKPSSHFCQICKQEFDDYLKHILHPLHQRRQKETEKSFSLDSLKDILQIKRVKNKKLTWVDAPQDQEETHSATSLETSSLKSTGSKKRIVLREGEMEPVSVASSTQCHEEDTFQEQPTPTPHRRPHRKYSNFRNLLTHST